MSSNGRNEATALDHTATASPEARQFAEIVEIRIAMKGFLGRDAELTLLETGIRDFNLSLPDARGIVRSVADRLNVPVEREVERTLAQYMKAAAGRRKKLSREHFEQATQIYQTQAHAEMDRSAVRARLKRLMEEHDLEPRRAGLLRSRRWYTRP